ncbi:MAG: 16S rRNA methyltransferase [Chloroflexota bacterium]
MSTLNVLIDSILSTSKYRHVSPVLVRRIGERELRARPKLKEAIKATKNKLHQVGAAYQVGQIDYARALADLQDVAEDEAALRQQCQMLMQRHASTRERIPILEQFYTTIFADLPPTTSVLDVACGLNPLALPWMSLADGAEYIGYDIYADSIGFLQQFASVVGRNGRFATRDVITQPPTDPVDLALILKTLPCLEQVDKNASNTLLDAIQANYLVISYPARSLGGRRKGMVANYEQHLQGLASSRSWDYQRFEFETELAFLVQT